MTLIIWSRINSQNEKRPNTIYPLLRANKLYWIKRILFMSILFRSARLVFKGICNV